MTIGYTVNKKTGSENSELPELVYKCKPAYKCSATLKFIYKKWLWSVTSC